MILLTDKEIYMAIPGSLDLINDYPDTKCLCAPEYHSVAKAQLKKVWLRWTETPHRIVENKQGRYGLDCDDVRAFWEALLKEIK